MTHAEAIRQAHELGTHSDCVRETARWLDCSLGAALAIERLETLLMAEDLPERRTIEANLRQLIEANATRRAA